MQSKGRRSEKQTGINLVPEKSSLRIAGSVGGVSGQAASLELPGLTWRLRHGSPDQRRRGGLGFDVSGSATRIVAESRRHFVTHGTGSLNP